MKVKNAAKEYLQKIAWLDTMINQKLDAVDNLETLIMRTTPTLHDDVSSGGGYQDKISSAVAKIVDLKTEIDADVDRYADMKKQAYDLLNEVKNPNHVLVLHQRYFLHRNFDEIAEGMSYTERGVCYIHGRALQEFERVMTAHGITAEGGEKE